MLGVVGLIVPEFFHLPMYNSGATVYDNAFTVRTHKVPSPTHPQHMLAPYNIAWLIYMLAPYTHIHSSRVTKLLLRKVSCARQPFTHTF
jgi:hypothetical protein